MRWSELRVSGALLSLAVCSGCFMEGYDAYLRDGAADSATNDQEPPTSTSLRDAGEQSPDDSGSSASDAGSEPDARSSALPDSGGLDASDATPPVDASMEADAMIAIDASADARSDDTLDAAPLDAGADAMSDAARDASPNLGCTGQASCTLQCNSSPCELDCGDAGVCNATCRAGEVCEIDCDLPTKCNVTCQAGATCDTFCRNIADCAIDCQAGAACRNICATGMSCGFTPPCAIGNLDCRSSSGCGGRGCM